jgi:hypothetical protein
MVVPDLGLNYKDEGLTEENRPRHAETGKYR